MTPREGSRRYELFHGRPPDAVHLYRVPRLIPPVLVRVGSLRGLIYRSDKWHPGLERDYIHFMQDPPVLACSPDGRRLFIVGGSYEVTERGIEG